MTLNKLPDTVIPKGKRVLMIDTERDKAVTDAEALDTGLVHIREKWHDY